MINRRRGKALTTNIPIYTLSGGVGRQAPSKRLPSETQDLVNAMVTVERSIEKRPGTDLMPLYLTGANQQDYTGDNLGLPDSDLEFFWHSLSDDARYLIVVDRNATTGKLYYVYYYDQANDVFVDHTEDDQTGIPAEVREYITYSETTPKLPLKLVSRGQNLVFLNPDVSAGYTSVYDEASGEWRTLTLGGVPTSTVDTIGGEVDYTTATRVDPAGIATYWDKYTSYATGTQVLYIAGSSSVPPATGDVDTVMSANTTITATDNADVNWNVIAYVGATDAATYDLDRIPAEVAVKDWEYPDSTKPQLGQSLPTFNDLTIPPLAADVEFGNNNANEMLKELYDLTDAEKNGKVYFIQTGYQGQAPGYYLAKSVTSPSFLKVRTPDPYSVLDAKRLPMELEFTGVAAGKSTWSWSTLDWDKRTSGDIENNPGPTAFKGGRQSKISTIAFFRNRLFMSAGDVIFSSRDGQFTDLWIEDPGVIVDTDPIDVAASANKFTPITSMVPFNEYMFINTNADTQYELAGSENQITPFTAQLQPMTFYSTAPLVDPLTLGNNIFFYDAERLYLYLGRGGSLSTAQELSAHCPKYLPTIFGSTAVAAAQDSLAVVDADSPSDVYLYSTRYRGDQVVQNAFFKYHYEGADVRSLQAWDNEVYQVVKRTEGFFIERQLMRYDDIEIPRLDRKQKISVQVGTISADRTGDNAAFDSSTFMTTVRIPHVLDAADSYFFVTENGEALTINSIVPSAEYTDITISGELSDGSYWIGEAFTMMAQLSPQFVRDEQNNPTEGVLSLASMVTRHYNTGNYDVLVQRRGRPVQDILLDYNARDNRIDDFMTSFAAVRADTFADSTLPVDNVEYQGELVSKIMGFSDKTEIYLLSDYFTPVNITNIQIRGKFKQTYSSII